MSFSADNFQRLSPTCADVSYGPHQRNVLDFWKAEGDGPRPLLFYIHGGDWTAGDKHQESREILPFLRRGISYAAVSAGQTSVDPKVKLPSENARHGIHHPVFGLKMKEKSDQMGHECHLLISGISKSEKYAGPNEFLMAKLLGP